MQASQTATATTKKIKVKRKWGQGEVRRHIEYGLMLVPGAMWLFIFCYLPMGGIILAFKQFRMHMPKKGDFFQNPFINSMIKSEWVGFKNFEFIFKTPDAWLMTRNTVLYNLAFILIGLVLSVALAIAITELRQRRMAKLYQTIFFFPFFLSWIVISYLLFAMLNTNMGIFNQILERFGREPIKWYMEPKYWPFIMLFANRWRYTGNGSIIYLAAITGMDSQLFEAATIDGASKWQQIWRITIPLLVPIMVLLTILAAGRVFNADFAMFYALPNGSGVLRRATLVIDVYVFNSLRGGIPIGMPAAAGLYQSFVGFILILTTNWIVRRVRPDMALF